MNPKEIAKMTGADKKNNPRNDEMNMPRDAMLFTTIFAAVLILLAADVCALDISISPASINAPNMMRGGFYQNSISIRSISDTPTSVRLELDPGYNRTNRLITLNPNLTEYTLTREKPIEINVTIRPDNFTESDNYTTYLRFYVKDGSQGNNSGVTYFKVETSLAAKISFNLTEEQNKDCRSFYEKVNSAEQGEKVIFTSMVINDGNVEFAPSIKLDVWDREQKNIVKTIDSTDNFILPSLSKNIMIEIPTTDLSPGQYWLSYSTPECSAKGLLTFDILKPGELKTSGKLLYIKNKAWVDIDEPVDFVAAFQNTGLSAVNAKFVGTIRINGKTKKDIETQNQFVEPGKVVYFTFSYTPDSYEIFDVTGKIYFGTKITDQYTSKLNINPDSKRKTDYKPAILISGVLITIIVFLVAIILKKKKLKKHHSQGHNH